MREEDIPMMIEAFKKAEERYAKQMQAQWKESKESQEGLCPGGPAPAQETPR